MTFQLFFDLILDAALDTLKMSPFLFLAFFLLETLEHYSGSFVSHTLERFSDTSQRAYSLKTICRKITGPAIGALFGCIPQCGFSVMAANLYAGGVLTPGTLLAVFLSTSDEAILILLGSPQSAGHILPLILTKIVIAIVAGTLTDLFLMKFILGGEHKQIEDMCTDCGCDESHGALLPALRHTVKLLLYIFVFTGILNILIEVLGLDTITTFLLGGSILQPCLTALIGFIPNCAASVLLTQLFLNGSLSFASVISGLCTNAGLGLVVLLKTNHNKKENFRFILTLYVIAVLSGILLS